MRILPARILGTAVGGVILITNMKTFLGAVGVSGPLAILIYVAIVAIWIAALVFSIRVNRQEEGTGVAGSSARPGRLDPSHIFRKVRRDKKLRHALDTILLAL